MSLRRRLIVALSVIAAGLAACSAPGPASPDPDNALPFGYLDTPTNDQTVGRQVQVSGWALDDSGVRDVRIFVDGRYRTSASLTVPRPDVTNAYALFANGTDVHGWSTIVDLGEQAVRHNIIAQAVDDQGATRDIGSVEVTVMAPE
jgi:hypothetical protein